MYFLQTVIDALSLGSLYALAALGIGLLFGIMRLINFAHGDFIALSAYALILPTSDVVSTLFIGNLSWPLLIVAILAFGVVVALLSNALVFKRMRTASPQNLMVVSFALGFVIQNLIMIVYGARPKAVGLGASFEWRDFWVSAPISLSHSPLLSAASLPASFHFSSSCKRACSHRRWRQTLSYSRSLQRLSAAWAACQVPFLEVCSSVRHRRSCKPTSPMTFALSATCSFSCSSSCFC
jgi:hypothetical protein